MSTPPAPMRIPPGWPHCGHGSDPATDPVGCPGIHVPGHTACLAHLDDDDRTFYLDGLFPGADVDHRGTPFTSALVLALREALTDPTTRSIHVGEALFSGAHFSGDAGFAAWKFTSEALFDGAHFSGRASFGSVTIIGEPIFDGAQFTGTADFNDAHICMSHFTGAQFFSTATFEQTQFADGTGFHGAHFNGRAIFDNAQFSMAYFGEAHFSGEADFNGAQFTDTANFTETQFSSTASFRDVQFTSDAHFFQAQFSAAEFFQAQFSSAAVFGHTQFSGPARFGDVQFSGPARFVGVHFSDDADFRGAQFAVTPRLEAMVCAGVMDLSGVVFKEPVALEVAGREVRCERTRWESTATLRLRYATVDLSHAVLSFPVAVAAHPTAFRVSNFTGTSMAMSESLLAGHLPAVQVTSVRGVDAAHLMLTDTDLSDCLFSGAFHLDQLRLEGRCAFAPTPTGLHRRNRIWPYRWSRRRALAEEHHWRAHTANQPTSPRGQVPSPRDWRTGPDHPDPDLTPDPEDVAALYRQLRKAFEDGKNEPGAADFYYGEMEMRRHDRIDTPPGERALLWGYWLLSGYGLRASRALGWLFAAVAATIVLMMGLGLPDSSPQQVATGTVPAGGGKVTLVVDKKDPRLTLPVGDRFTVERFDKAVQVVLNSVVFRTSGQDLTTWGTYTEMVSRFTEPVLLALAVLAMRSRIKR
ncbi:pentapeptide repeat-containing protein [Streptomyces sp. NPDC057580]|uniref:pentapeptide repeat-containing protein n=1 Tax=Streptomyces sp. NPDC057580 TaxID=3346173 RepID=UPI0036AEBAA9